MRGISGFPLQELVCYQKGLSMRKASQCEPKNNVNASCGNKEYPGNPSTTLHRKISLCEDKYNVKARWGIRRVVRQ